MPEGQDGATGQPQDTGTAKGDAVNNGQAGGAEVSLPQLLAAITNLTNEVKVTKGTADRAVTDNQRLRQDIQALLAQRNTPAMHPADPKAMTVEDYCRSRNLDASDPINRAIAQDFIDLRREVAQARGASEEMQMTERQRQQLAYEIETLQRVAKTAGLDWQAIEAQVRGLPPGQLWQAGLTAIEQAASGRTIQPTKEQIDAAVAERLKELGIMDDRPRGGSVPAGNLEALKRANARIGVDPDYTPEDFARDVERLTKRGAA